MTLKKRTTKTTKTTSDLKEVYKVKFRIGEHLYESGRIDETPVFFVNSETNYPSMLPCLIVEDESWTPISPEKCGYEPYSFTKEEYEALLKKPIKTEELLDEIYECVNKYVYATEISKILITIDILMTYAQEHLQTIHFPFAVGETESGKSSILHLVKHLGYRCLYVEGINKANVYNFLGMDEEATGTLAEDEVQDLYKNPEKINMYKNSYAKGSKQPVILMGNNGSNKEQVFYKIFCSKWFAGERIPENKGFKERLAIIYMTSGKTNGNIKKLKEEERQQLSQLRKKLLVWKLQNANTPLHDIDSGLKQRDQELWEDFLAITFGTKYYEKSKKVAEYYVQQRHQNIWNSREAWLFQACMEGISDEFKVKFVDLWTKLLQKDGVEDATLGSIFSDEHGKISKTTVSKIFQEKFLAHKIITIETGGNGKNHQVTYYQFDKDICQTLYEKYHPNLPVTHPLFNDPSGQSGQSTNWKN